MSEALSGPLPPRRRSGSIIEWLMPLGFAACAAWLMWNAPAFIIAFGGGTDALMLRHATAGPLDWIALIGAPVFFVAGMMTARTAKMEYDDLRGFDRVSLFIGRVTMVLIAVIVMVMFYEVVLRYVFEKPTLWANELSLWMAGFIFLLSGLYAMGQRCHIRIFLLYDMFPRSVQRVCDTISALLIVAFAFFMVWGSYNEARDKFLRWETFGTAFDPPIPATLKGMVLLSISLVAFQAVWNLIMDWNRAPEIHTDEPDAAEIEEIRAALKDKS